MISKEKVLNEIRDFIADFTDNSDLNITNETVFESIPNWDSLCFVSTVTFIQEKYQIEIDTDQLLNIHSVNDLINSIDS